MDIHWLKHLHGEQSEHNNKGEQYDVGRIWMLNYWGRAAVEETLQYYVCTESQSEQHPNSGNNITIESCKRSRLKFVQKNSVAVPQI